MQDPLATDIASPYVHGCQFPRCQLAGACQGHEFTPVHSLSARLGRLHHDDWALAAGHLPTIQLPIGNGDHPTVPGARHSRAFTAATGNTNWDADSNTSQEQSLATEE